MRSGRGRELRTYLFGFLSIPLMYAGVSSARANPGAANTHRITAIAECANLLGQRLTLDFSDDELIGGPSTDVRRILGDLEFEERLGRTLIRVAAISDRTDSPGAGNRKEVRKLWNERQTVALRLANREIAEDWANHLRKGFSARERGLRMQLGDEGYESASTEILANAVSK